jgi:hypothetical protein
MKLLSVLALAILYPISAFGQAETSQPGLPRVSMVAGVGNAMGLLGVQAERYVSKGRFSLFGGLGYWPEIESGDPSGIAIAAGARGFTRGLTHRGFVEVSVSQVATETVRLIETDEIIDGSRLYGPGVQIGYQYASGGGLTGLLSAGVGFPVGAQSDTHAALMVGFGLGYTWR